MGTSFRGRTCGRRELQGADLRQAQLQGADLRQERSFRARTCGRSAASGRGLAAGAQLQGADLRQGAASGRESEGCNVLSKWRSCSDPIFWIYAERLSTSLSPGGVLSNPDDT
ncbi:MAG: pentapeptide repeat-containing protein [Candidatus Competibacter sp.]